MDATRSSSDTDDIRVLLAGPASWREQVRPAFEADDAFSTRAAETAERARATVTDCSDAVDCVVCARRFDGTTGLELLTDRRSNDGDVPVVLTPTDGDESLASEAIAAGVADYVPADADAADLRRRCRRAVERREVERRRRTKADQFESFFATPSQFTAVLDTDATVVRVNSGALDYLRTDESDVLGERFWGLPWTDSSRRELQRAIRRARAGEYTDFEAGLPDAGGGDGEEGETRFEFTVRPVADRGEVTHLVVEGREVAERVRLEEELRESEELHRVTLNNMTDTILVTDDEGAFSYVCPNVHFIFGYSAEEIRDFGTIDALLGEDLFDRERLESEGVLTNIECTATDKHGREHTLLVNVREVSIQGGTTLYSCRDITKRKQRERALTQLHRTSRRLLYAETKPEIGDIVVSDAASILPSAAAAVYQFDRERNVLYPTAVSDELRGMLGTLSELRLDRETVVGRAFVEDETLTSGPADRDACGQTSLSTLGDYVVVPLSDHGVLVASAAGDGTFDEVGEEVTELLAATTEAAFDRVERENELRERDRTLQRQNERLSKLNRVNEFIREIDQALVGAESREKIETAVCERLTDDDRFAFAWVGTTTSTDRTLRPRAWAGDEQGYLDAVALEPDGDAETAEPSVRTTDEREAVLVSNVADRLRTAPWCKEAVSRDFLSVLSIPITYDDVSFGTLTVYASQPNAFDDMVQSVLRELGDTVASAINAVLRKEALQSDTVVELEYHVSDPNGVLGRLADETGASLEVEGEVARDDGTTLVFTAVEDAELGDVVGAAETFVGVRDAEPIREVDDDRLVGLQVRDGFSTQALADHGAVLRQLRATPDGISMTIDVPSSVTTRSIDEVVSNNYDTVELIARRKRTRALDTEGRPGRFLDDLTERQLEVAQMAYHAGFFDFRRDVTGREVASMLDISHTAFYDHIRRIQRKLFASLFENRPRPTGVE